ncbi:MAG: hypothetical protein ACFFDH_12870, partial [Promethearchaeota archaeon]
LKKMPYLFLTVKYPSHKIDELAKKLVEIVPKYPPDPSLGELVVRGTRAVGEGIISLNIYTVKEGKLEESIAQRSKMVSELRNIEGLEYSIEVWVTIVEAYDSIGIKLPEQSII